METIYVGGEIPVSSTPKVESAETSKVSSAKKTAYDSEEKTKLKLDIESIDSLIDEKEQKISKNINKWYYKYFNTLVIVYGISISALAVSLGLSLCLAFFLFINKSLMMMGLSLCFGATGIAFKDFISKAKNIDIENDTLQTDINYLKEIKKQKTVELESHTKQASADINLPIRTQSKTRSKIEIYKEVLKIIQSMTDTPSPEMVEEVRQVVEEIEQHSRHKTLTNLERN